MSTTHSVNLLSNGTATGDAKQWPGGRGVALCAASFDTSASIALQILLPDGSTYVDVSTETTFTADGLGGFDLPPCILKATVTGTISGGYLVAARVNL